MALKQTQHISAIFFLFLMLSAVSHALPDVDLKIKNESSGTILYLVDNFKYDDAARIWKPLAPNSTATEAIGYTTKFGYLELRIRKPGADPIFSYTPSGENLNVTILIKDDPNSPDNLIISKGKNEVSN